LEKAARVYFENVTKLQKQVDRNIDPEDGFEEEFGAGHDEPVCYPAVHEDQDGSSAN